MVLWDLPVDFSIPLIISIIVRINPYLHLFLQYFIFGYNLIKSSHSFVYYVVELVSKMMDV